MASTYTALKIGDRNDSVKELQTALNAAGYSLTVDGVFGSRTLDAVKKYQTAQGLTASGTVDEGTWNALNGVSSGTPEETPSASSAASLLAQLQQALASGQGGYTPKTPEQIREQAEGEYQSYYDQLKLTAQQQQQQSDLALQQQRDGLKDTYDKQREDSTKQYRQAYSQTDRAMLGRGMQRSSYTAQTLANLLQEGAEAQQDIGDAQAAAEGKIDAQRAQLAQQLAAQLGQYDAAKQADILARIRELEDQEYQRELTGTQNQQNLTLQLWKALYQGERDKISDEQWQKQFAESVRQYESSRRSSSSSTKTTTGSTGTDGTTTTSGTTTTPVYNWPELLKYLSGGSGKQAGTLNIEAAANSAKQLLEKISQSKK